MSKRVNTDDWEIKENHLLELRQRINQFSPDYMERKLEHLLPVFVYGTLKSGGRLHEILKGSPWLGEAHTALSSFWMQEVAEGGFPIVWRIPKESPELGKSGFICGEVYVVDPVTLLELDRIERNTVMYQRGQHHVYLLDQKYKLQDGYHTPSLKCWMYSGNPDFWGKTRMNEVPPKLKAVKGVTRKTYSWNQYQKSN